MSIILKGIDLPNGPIKLVLYPSGKVDEYVFNERIATDYQAIQIPTPHGRLIDADLFKEIIKDSVPSWTIGVKIPTYGDMDIMDKIYFIPTILEAEEK